MRQADPGCTSCVSWGKPASTQGFRISFIDFVFQSQACLDCTFRDCLRRFQLMSLRYTLNWSSEMLLWGVASKPAMEHSQSVQAKILENLRFDPVTRNRKRYHGIYRITIYLYSLYSLYMYTSAVNQGRFLKLRMSASVREVCFSRRLQCRLSFSDRIIGSNKSIYVWPTSSGLGKIFGERVNLCGSNMGWNTSPGVFMT